MSSNWMADFCDQCLAVVVLYKTSIADSATLASLSKSLERVGGKMDLLVYDNSPDYNSGIGNISFRWKIYYIGNPSNPGISTAYNSGFCLAKEAGKRWLLFLDQDTSFPINTFEVYALAVQKHKAHHLFAPILVSGGGVRSPCNYKLMRGSPMKVVGAGVLGLRGKSLLNSGLLVSLHAFSLAGGYNEKIPLDFSDHDFIRRLANKQKEAIIINLTCGHSLSTDHSSDRHSVMRRFETYWQGGIVSANGLVDATFLRFWGAIKGIKYFLRCKDIKFIRILLRYFFKMPWKS